MDCEDDDDIYTSPEPHDHDQAQVASTSGTQLEHPVARTRTSRISKARQSLKFKNKHTVSGPRLQTSA
jgi:hypothetical protein